MADAEVDEGRGGLSFWQRDPVFRLLLDRWGLGERGVAVLTAALGFGVLTTWYLIGLTVDPAAHGRRGLFEYWSGSVGDLVLLPLLTATAVRYSRQVLEGLRLAVAAGRRHSRWLVGIIERAYNAPSGLAFVLAVTGAAVLLQHVDEVYGLDRNWTVPEWGRLTPVAVYHQAFFSFQTFIVASLAVRHIVTVRLLLRLGREHSTRAGLYEVARRSLRLFGWALLGWGAFVSLRVTDFFYLAPTVSASALTEFPAAVTTLVAYYVLLLVTGVIPTLTVARRYEESCSRAPLRLIGACFIVPILAPSARLLAAWILTV